MNYTRISALVSFILLLLMVYQPLRSEPSAEGRKSSHEVQIPEPIRIEHKHLHRQLEQAINSGGKTGEAAEAVAKRLGPHFEREEEIAMPPLGLLSRLSQGTATEEEMQEVLPLTEQLRDELPEMLEEHQHIVSALTDLSKAAKTEDKPEIAEFAEKLILHARMEEEVLYPAALLVGAHIKLKLKEPPSTPR